MNKFLIVVTPELLMVTMVALCLNFAAGCGPKAIDAQVVAANTIAGAVNATTPVLREAEQAEGMKLIDAAPDKATARAQLAALELKWTPVWKAHEAARIAQDSWASVLEKGGTTDVALLELRRAFCTLRTIVPPEVQPKLPKAVVTIVCAASP